MHLSPTAETVVEIDGGTRDVEDDILDDAGLCCDGLEVEGALLLNETQISGEIIGDRGIGREITFGPIWSIAREITFGPIWSISSAPRGYGVLPKRREDVVGDVGVLIISVDGDSIGVEPSERTLLDDHMLCTLQANRALSLQCPVSTGGICAWLHEGGSIACDSEPVEHHVFDGCSLCALNIEQDIEGRHLHLWVRQRAIIVVVEQKSIRVLKVNVFVVCVLLFQHILDEPFPSLVIALAALVATPLI
jgi:hypothetical protein